MVNVFCLLCRVVLILFLAFLFCGGPPFQSSGWAQVERHTPLELELPDYKNNKDKESFVLPEVPLLEGEQKTGDLSRHHQILVTKIRFEGNTAISDEELGEIAAAYENRPNTFEDLQELRHRITLLYVNRGYINSGAVIPDQRVESGEVLYRIIEGWLADITFTGNKRLRSEYVRGRLLPGDDSPLNINQLQEKLRLLHQNPLIRKMNVELRPGLNLGEGVITARVTEETPYEIGLSFANNRSPSIGSHGAKIQVAHHNLTGWGDTLGLAYDLAEGADEFSAHYSLPLNYYDTSLSIYFNRSATTVVEEPFNIIDIESKSDTFGMSVSHPLYKTLDHTFSLSLAGEKRKSETFLLGVPFSFSAGYENGKSEITVLRFSQDWQLRKSREVFAARSVFSLGLDAFGATKNNSGPDGRFFTWQGQFQWARRLSDVKGAQLLFRTDCQLAADPLLPMEQFSVGGADSVRGYRENLMVRDNGLSSSLELRVPLFRLPLLDLSEGQEEGKVQLAPFFDWGYAWNTDRHTPSQKNLSSIGLGIRWDPTSKIHAQVYWGIPMRHVDNLDNDLQDSGIHFSVSMRYP